MMRSAPCNLCVPLPVSPQRSSECPAPNTSKPMHASQTCRRPPSTNSASCSAVAKLLKCFFPRQPVRPPNQKLLSTIPALDGAPAASSRLRDPLGPACPQKSVPHLPPRQAGCLREVSRPTASAFRRRRARPLHHARIALASHSYGDTESQTYL